MNNDYYVAYYSNKFSLTELQPLVRGLNESMNKKNRGLVLGLILIWAPQCSTANELQIGQFADPLSLLQLFTLLLLRNNDLDLDRLLDDAVGNWLQRLETNGVVICAFTMCAKDMHHSLISLKTT